MFGAYVYLTERIDFYIRKLAYCYGRFRTQLEK